MKKEGDLSLLCGTPFEFPNREASEARQPEVGSATSRIASSSSLESASEATAELIFTKDSPAVQEEISALEETVQLQRNKLRYISNKLKRRDEALASGREARDGLENEHSQQVADLKK